MTWNRGPLKQPAERDPTPQPRSPQQRRQQSPRTRTFAYGSPYAISCKLSSPCHSRHVIRARRGVLVEVCFVLLSWLELPLRHIAAVHGDHPAHNTGLYWGCPVQSVARSALSWGGRHYSCCASCPSFRRVTLRHALPRGCGMPAASISSIAFSTRFASSGSTSNSHSFRTSADRPVACRERHRFDRTSNAR